MLAKIRQHLLLSVSKPSFGILDTTRGEKLGSAPALVGEQIASRCRVHQLDDGWRRHPESAAHAVVADQAAIDIQRLLHRFDRGMGHPCHGRKEHRDGVGRVQGYQVVRYPREVIGPGTRQQAVSLGQSSPPFLNVDSRVHVLTVARVGDNSAPRSDSIRPDEFRIRQGA